MKKYISLILAALTLSAFLTGCNNSNKNSGTGQISFESTDQFAEDYVYGTYVDDLDFYLNQHFDNRTEMQNSFRENEKFLAKSYAEDSIRSLGKVKAMQIPAALKEKHEKLLGAVDIEIRIMELNKELTEFIGKTDSLTPDEQSTVTTLNKRANEILKESEEYGSIKKHWIEVRKEACKHLSKGEYNTYNFTLDTYCSIYFDSFVELLNIFFNDKQVDALKHIDNCEKIFSHIENMDVPESMESYHKDIVDAIPSEKEFITLIKEYETIRRQHPGVEFDSLPEDVKKKLNDIEEEIDTFLNAISKDGVITNTMIEAAAVAGEYARKQLNQ